MALPHPRVTKLRQEGDKLVRTEPVNIDRAQLATTGAARSDLAKEEAPKILRPARRGRKPFPVTDSVKRGLIRILCYTDVPFEHVASAVEQAGGQGKQWLRKLVQDTTGTGPGSRLHLADIRLGDKVSSDRRQREQEAALDLAARLQTGQATSTTSEERIHNGQDPSHVTPLRSLSQSSQPRQRVKPSSQIPTSLTSCSTVEEKQKDAKRTLSMSSIARNLERITGVTPGFYRFIGRQRSETANTIASRLSFKFSSPNTSPSGSSISRAHSSLGQDSQGANDGERSCPTSSSEYVRLYHHPQAFDYVSQTRQLDKQALQDSTNMSAVLCIVHARRQSMTAAETELLLQTSLPSESKAANAFVNGTDTNGVSALHVAVAFGLMNACSLLIQNGANRCAVTKNGTSVYHFAKPAQKLARHSLNLYTRIVYLRQWAKYGGQVPIPRHDDHQSMQAFPSHQRSATISTLDTVEEKPREESSSYARSGWVNGRGIKRKANIPLNSASADGFHQVPSAYSTWDCEDGPSYLPRRTDSPESYASSKASRQRIQLETLTAPSSGVKDFCGWVHTNQGAPYSSAMPLNETTYQTNGVSNALTQNSVAGVRSLPHGTLEGTPSRFDAYHDPYHADFNSDKQPLEVPHTNLTGGSYQQHTQLCENVMCAGECYSAYLTPSATDISPITDFYTPHEAEWQLNYGTAPSTRTQPQMPLRDVLGSLVPSISADQTLTNTSENLFLPILDPTSVPWFSCMHGRPRNYQESFCQYCPPMAQTFDRSSSPGLLDGVYIV